MPEAKLVNLYVGIWSGSLQSNEFVHVLRHFIL